MNLQQARDVLDACRLGLPVSQALLNAALVATGDVDLDAEIPSVIEQLEAAL